MSTIEPSLPQVCREGVLESLVNRQILKVSQARANLKIDTLLLLSSVNKDAIAHHSALEDQRGIVDGANFRIPLQWHFT